MPEYSIPRICGLQDIPEFQRLQANNLGHFIDEHQTAVMYGRAIHWISFFQILWPPFDKVDFYMEEVSTIVHNDPDREILPIAFYRQITEILKTFWTIQLTNLYPDGDWTVEVIDDPEMTIQATIRKRHK